MTTLKDKIREVLIKYQRDTNDGCAEDLQVLEEAIMEEIVDFTKKLIG